MGVKEMKAGSTQTPAIIIPTVRFVMYNGYSSGRHMAKYLREEEIHHDERHRRRSREGFISTNLSTEMQHRCRMLAVEK
jgi:hypothetical protein